MSTRPTPSTSDGTYALISSAYTSHISQQSPSTSRTNDLVARSFGYTALSLSTLPGTSNLGVSCGNPLALAHLQPGETIVDLGSGGGLDVFLASPFVGATGRAIGVDMTPAMVTLARRNAEKGGYGNVEFVLARVTAVPLDSGCADVVVSNCVINLVPQEEKKKVFEECWRLLKSGGRLAVSDLLARGELPEMVRSDAALLVGCVAGASRVDEYEAWLRGVGFKDVVFVDTKSDLNVYKEGILSQDAVDVADAGAACCAAKPKPKPKPELKENGCCGADVRDTAETQGATGSAYRERLEKLDLNEYVGAYQIYAIKP